MNEDRPADNERPRDQLRGEAAALNELRRERDKLRLEREEFRRERESERQQAEARIHDALRRAEAAEMRIAEFEAEIGALRHELRSDADARDDLRRERDHERQQAEARLDELLQRAEAAETRVAELDAEIGEGILGRLRGLCEAVRTTLQSHWPGTGGR